VKKNISQVTFNLIGFESAFGWGKRIYIKSPLLGCQFCEIFYFIIVCMFFDFFLMCMFFDLKLIWDEIHKNLDFRQDSCD